MSAGAGASATAGLDCHVRCVGTEEEALPDALARDLVSLVEARAREWGSRICAFLDREHPGPVMITLRPGAGFPMSRGDNILLPVNANTEGSLAALAHELVHVVAGRSSSPLLNEGLAVHVDDRLRLAGPAWPFYHLSPHRWVGAFRAEGTSVPLARLVSRPTFRYSRTAGRSVVWRSYLHAGSFARFLADHLGTEAFEAAFRAEPWAPDHSRLVELERAWLAALGGPLSAAEEQRRDESLVELELVPPTGWKVEPPGRTAEVRR